MLIGFIGSPGCGKSTTAFGLCTRLKQDNYPVEFYAEYARYQIMQCRAQGIAGNGGDEGQKTIYDKDSSNALFYRNHSDSICVTDGSTVNCHFYGLQGINFDAEIAKYDVLFYVPVVDVPLNVQDANRMQNKQEILDMAVLWEKTIRPLMKTHSNIIELTGYPTHNAQEMQDAAYAILKNILVKKSQVKTGIAA